MSSEIGTNPKKEELVAYIHISLDLETTGNKPGCGILALGAYVFATEFIASGKLYEYGASYYSRVLPSNNIRYGLMPLAETMDWWEKQKPAVQAEAFSGTMGMKAVLTEFSGFCGRLLPQEDGGAEIVVWGNDQLFDVGILQAAYVATGLPIPWKYWNGRCYRTLKASFGEIARIKPEIAHHALYDAVAQGNSILAILHRVRELKDFYNEVREVAP